MTEKDHTQAWSGRRTLVTGVAGFIGSHLTEALVRAGGSVRAFARYNSRNDLGWLDTVEPDVLGSVEVFRGDLANPEAVAGAVMGCDIILHLGALIPIPYSYRHPREFVAANVEGTLNVLEAARREEVSRVVHTSSSEVYGTAMTVPISESHPLNPQSPYAATKVAADQLALSYRHSFDTPVVVVRPFNTYGPRQSARAVIPSVISQALSRDTVEVGSLHPTRDFTYVEDTVAGIMLCGTIDDIEGEAINLGSGVEVAIKEVVERVSAVLERELPVRQTDERTRPPDSEVERLLADASKAKELLGWQVSVSLDDGLRRTIDWLREWLPVYKPSLYNV